VFYVIRKYHSSWSEKFIGQL